MNYFVSYYVKNKTIKNTEVPLNGRITGINTIRDIEQYIEKMEKVSNVNIICWKPWDVMEETKPAESQ